MSRRRNFEVEGLRHENPIPMGCIIGNLMMTSGIFGMEPGTRKVPDDVEGQCRLMFENVRRVIEAAGGSPEDIIKMVVWAKDKSFKQAMNKEWLAMFPDEHSRPDRTWLSCDVESIRYADPVTDVLSRSVYLRWRNANARHPDVIAAQRRERARIRSERQQRWGRPKIKAA